MTRYHSEIRQARSDLRHTAILEAAMAEFSDRGYHEASMDAVARRAGVAKGSIYTHFQSKKDLFLSVVAWGEAQLRNRLYELNEQNLPLRQKLPCVAKAYLDFIDKRDALFTVVFLEKLNFHTTLREQFFRQFNEGIAFLEQDMKKGIEEGIVRNGDPHLMAVMIQGIVNSLYFDYRNNTSGATIDTYLAAAIDMIDNAVFVNKGENA